MTPQTTNINPPSSIVKNQPIHLKNYSCSFNRLYLNKLSGTLFAERERERESNVALKDFTLIIISPYPGIIIEVRAFCFIWSKLKILVTQLSSCDLKE